MTPKEKAKELVDKYRHQIMMADKYHYLLDSEELDHAKACATIAVDILINEANEHIITIRYQGCKLNDVQYWTEVKNEINNIKFE